MLARLKRLLARTRLIGLEGTVKFAIAQRTGMDFSFRLSRNLARLSIRASQSDRFVFRQIFGDEELNIPLKVKPTSIIDAGANIGLASIYFALKFPEAKIIAVEPEQANFNLLVENASAFQTIKPVFGAVWPRKELLAIAGTHGGECAYFVDNKSSGPSVQSWTVPELLDQLPGGRADLVKIDIEGAELDLFSGDTAWLRQVRTLMVETHDRVRQGCTKAVTSALQPYVESHFRSGEYDVYYLAEK